jgi:hypothetical protein
LDSGTRISHGDDESMKSLDSGNESHREYYGEFGLELWILPVNNGCLQCSLKAEKRERGEGGLGL